MDLRALNNPEVRDYLDDASREFDEGGQVFFRETVSKAIGEAVGPAIRVRESIREDEEVRIAWGVITGVRTALHETSRRSSNV